MVEVDVVEVQLSNLARIRQGPANRLAEELLIEYHMRKENLLELGIILNAFQDLLEIVHVLEGDLDEAELF